MASPTRTSGVIAPPRVMPSLRQPLPPISNDSMQLPGSPDDTHAHALTVPVVPLTRMVLTPPTLRREPIAMPTRLPAISNPQSLGGEAGAGGAGAGADADGVGAASAAVGSGTAATNVSAESCVCGAPAVFECSRCGTKFYCSFACQRGDWKVCTMHSMHAFINYANNNIHYNQVFIYLICDS